MRPDAKTWCCVLAIAIPSTMTSMLAYEPALDTVLARAAAYVVEFQRQLSGIVAEESYVQSVRYPVGTSVRASLLLPTHRELTSDLLMVRAVGGDRWIQFRDVFSVDGKAVRDRSERLMQLFVAPTAVSASQAERISAESSRYNIGNLQRTVNVPVLALMVLDPENQPRFAFKRTDHRAPLLGRGAVAPPDEVWVVEFQEIARPTMIRTTNNRDLSARGDRHEVIAHCLTGGVLDHRVQTPGPSPDGKAA